MCIDTLSVVVQFSFNGKGLEQIFTFSRERLFNFSTMAHHNFSNHLNLEMEAECLTKTLSYLFVFKYLQNRAFKKYVRSRFLSFAPYPPFLPLFLFVQPPSPPLSPNKTNTKVHSFWLELTLSPSISILMKFREKKLIMSTSIFG